MTTFRRFLAAGLIAPALAAPAAAEDTAPRDPVTVEFFEKKIRSILADHCYACHSAETKPAGGLRVDDRNGQLAGGNSGAAVVPGDPEASLLLKRVVHADPKRKIPREGEPLSSEQVADLTRWIRGGAPWPPVRVPASLGRP